jgi:hypothetical protein
VLSSLPVGFFGVLFGLRFNKSSPQSISRLAWGSRDAHALLPIGTTSTGV